MDRLPRGPPQAHYARHLLGAFEEDFARIRQGGLSTEREYNLVVAALDDYLATLYSEDANRVRYRSNVYRLARLGAELKTRRRQEAETRRHLGAALHEVCETYGNEAAHEAYHAFVQQRGEAIQRMLDATPGTDDYAETIMLRSDELRDVGKSCPSSDLTDKFIRWEWIDEKMSWSAYRGLSDHYRLCVECSTRYLTLRRVAAVLSTPALGDSGTYQLIRKAVTDHEKAMRG